MSYPEPMGGSRYRERRDLDAPVLIAGKPYDQWSEQEKDWAALYALGPKFRAAVPAGWSPPTAEYYIPPIPGSACDAARSSQGSAAGI